VEQMEYKKVKVGDQVRTSDGVGTVTKKLPKRGWLDNRVIVKFSARINCGWFFADELEYSTKSIKKNS
jgi:hypothetical protein